MDRRAARGFSLAELLLVVALLAIAAGIALPGIGSLVDRSRTLVLADLLQRQLAHARALSVIRNRDVELCGSSDGERCDGNWRRGWMVHVPGEEGPVSWHRLDGREHVRWRRGLSNTIRFRSNGTSPLGNGRFHVCDGRGETVVWEVVISRQGRVRRVPAEANTRCD
jgi:type IV fimbrial biogenesis protein FimT